MRWKSWRLVITPHGGLPSWRAVTPSGPSLPTVGSGPRPSPGQRGRRRDPGRIDGAKHLASTCRFGYDIVRLVYSRGGGDEKESDRSLGKTADAGAGSRRTNTPQESPLWGAGLHSTCICTPNSTCRGSLARRLDRMPVLVGNPSRAHRPSPGMTINPAD